jgi:hypothetical protein
VNTFGPTIIAHAHSPCKWSVRFRAICEDVRAKRDVVLSQGWPCRAKFGLLTACTGNMIDITISVTENLHLGELMGSKGILSI